MTATPPSAAHATAPPGFTGYEKFLVGILAFLQFTLVLDFMILSPLGAMVMPALSITPQQFGLVVSSYAFAAAASGLLAAGFADRFDRKRLLMFFYVGFLGGTLLCGLAQTYHVLLAARVVTGIFGGVIGAVVLSIITDLFALERRGRVMGIVQTSFAVSQIVGIPLGLYLTNRWDWHAPFLLIVGVGAVVGIIMAARMRPVNAHLAHRQTRSPVAHLFATVSEPRHTLAFCVTALLATGGYMLMPFGAAFMVNNMKVDAEHLPVIYLITGGFMIFMGPLAGRASDRFGKYPVFLFGTILTIVMVLYYTHMGPTPWPVVAAVNVLLFCGIFSRIVPSQALLSAVPDIAQRGAFHSVSASLQQVSGGIAAALAGSLIIQEAGGPLVHFPRIGYVITGASLITLYFMYRIHKQIPEKTA